VARLVDGLLEAPAAPPSTASDGVSLRKSPSDTLTQAGALVGTLLYMAPELLGGANLAQPRSDIFSFGVMAYEVLTGTLPFEEPALVMAARSRGLLRVEPLDTMCPGLAPALARLLERCLSLDPATRPTAIALSEALGKIQSPR
jgi:serine/threonine-protein kinase